MMNRLLILLLALMVVNVPMAQAQRLVSTRDQMNRNVQFKTTPLKIADGNFKFSNALRSGDGYSWDFEDPSSTDSWTFIDADGDGYCWETDANYGHYGYNCMVSSSYIYPNPGTLDPDNWMISPLVSLNGTLTIWALNYSDYFADCFTVYACVGEFNSIDDFVPISNLVYPDASWSEYTFDLSQFGGQTGRFAIRHYNSYDMMRLYIDDISITAGTVISKTATPVITWEDTGDYIQVTAVGNGHICLYMEDMLVAEGEGEATYILPYGNEEEVLGFSATAQEDGMEISDYALCTVFVPAVIVPEQTCSPDIIIEFQENPHGCLVTINPCEPSDIFYCFCGGDGAWTDWALYDGPIFFSTVGNYSIEAYAVAEGKLESEHVTSFFVVYPLQQTATPVITWEDTGDGIQVTAVGNGHICLYMEDMLVAEGEGEAAYFLPYGNEEEEFGFSATAQEDGKEVSNYALCTVYVPAFIYETPAPVIDCNLTDDALVITVTGEGTVTLYVQFIDNATGGITTETYSGYGDVTLSLPRTDETYYINYWAVAQIDGGYPGVTGMEYFVEIPAKEDVPVLVGDVDGDGQVTISDVTTIIDYLLSNDVNVDDHPAADVNYDGIISIGDVTELIDYLLTGTW